MRKKVLIISTSFPRWDNDRFTSFVYHFASSIKVAYNVHVLAPHAKGAKKQENMNGIEVYRFVYASERYEKFGTGVSIVDIIKSHPSAFWLVPFFVLFAFVKIVKLQFKNRYDVIHVNWLVPFGPLVGLLRIFFKFRYILTSHGSDVFPFVNRPGALSFIIGWLHRMFTLPNVDWIVTVSKALRVAVLKMLPDVPEKKISVISMGINYDRFGNQKRQNYFHKPLRVVFVGRLVEVKGVKYLIDAMNILKKKNIDFELKIYGDGNLRDSLKYQVDNLALSEFITFYGFVSHDLLPKKLAEADIFVGPSVVTSLGEEEGFGLVLLEALAAGLVVIGSRVGGIPDIVADRETGILVPPKAPVAIAQAIELLLKDDKLRAKIVENGKKYASEYDWSIIARKYIKLYDMN